MNRIYLFLSSIASTPHINNTSCCEIEAQISNKEKQMQLRCVLLVLSLSIHSVFEGMALAIQCVDLKTSRNLGISLIPHKIAVGLTISFQLHNKFPEKKKTIVKTILIFWACITPIGMLLTILLRRYVAQDRVNQFFEGVNIFALGTFFYVLFFEVAPEEFGHHHGLQTQDGHRNDLKMVLKSLILICGVALTYGFSICIPHSHVSCGDVEIKMLEPDPS